jgi:uncharacterized protein
MVELVASEKQRKFGQDKRDTLPGYCRECPWLSVCNGECPNHRFADSPDGESRLNYLCAGYKAFFQHSDPYMRIMADLIRKGRSADGILNVPPRAEGPAPEDGFRGVGRNHPCPCGSGLKFKKCHGQ